MQSKHNNFLFENICGIITNSDYINKNLDDSTRETNNLNFQNLLSKETKQIKTVDIKEEVNKNNQIYTDIPTYSKDNKNEPPQENNSEAFFENNIFENNELYNDNDELHTEKNQIQNSISQDSVENVFKYKLNINEEQFQKDYLDEKGESEKPRKIRSKHDYLIKSFLSNSINTYSFGKLNKLVKKLKLGKIYKCDYIKNIKANERHLRNLLEKTIEEIFSIYDEEAGKKDKKQKNKKVFESFFESISDKIDLSEDEEELLNLLKSTYEEELKLYYKSKEIEKFKNKKFKHGTADDYDKEFYNERNRGYYLLEPYGFIRYANSEPYCHNERKKNKINFID